MGQQCGGLDWTGRKGEAPSEHQGKKPAARTRNWDSRVIFSTNAEVTRIRKGRRAQRRVLRECYGFSAGVSNSGDSFSRCMIRNDLLESYRRGSSPAHGRAVWKRHCRIAEENAASASGVRSSGKDWFWFLPVAYKRQVMKIEAKPA